MSGDELTNNIYKNYRLASKYTPRSVKISNLLKLFIINNKPYIEYRLARKFYDYVVSRWKCEVIDSEMEDVYIEIRKNLLTHKMTQNDINKIIEMIHSALNNSNEPLEHKLTICEKIFNMPTCLTTQFNIKCKTEFDNLIKSKLIL